MMMLWLVVGLLFAMTAAQVWMVLRVWRQDRLVKELGQKTMPEAVQVLVEKRYAELLHECLTRQPQHEAEHMDAHGGHFTAALRVGNIANRFERKIHAAGMPPLSRAERYRRAKEAMWPRK